MKARLICLGIELARVTAGEASPARTARWAARGFWWSETRRHREHGRRKSAGLKTGTYNGLQTLKECGAQPGVAVLLGGAAEGNVDGRSVFAIEGGGAGVDGVKFGAGLEEADAAVPAENAVVIPGGADFFGFGEAAQSFFNERKKNVGRTAGLKLGFGAAFMEKTGVVVSLIGIA
jgi:hypothetical protein